MLAPLVPWFVSQGYGVSVIGRSMDRLQQMIQKPILKSQYVTPIAVDYHDIPKLHRWIEHIQLMQGPLDIVVGWIHDPKGPVLEVICEEIHAYRYASWRFIDVVSASRRQSLGQDVFDDSCKLQQVILGYKRTGVGARWLTHDEIVSGVIRAIEHPEYQLIRVGDTSMPQPREFL